ncbi:MAG: phosphate butyryltransferase [Deltaproteobacteria bacterium]|nr:phosphate butyryltransferase [Deltaproteobacteria bacterium]
MKRNKTNSHGNPPIRSFADIDRLAARKGPKRLAVLAPDDEEFMRAVKISHDRGYIEPVLIGNRERIEETARSVGFDMAGIQVIFEDDRQNIANRGTAMLFAGEVDIASKGQLPTVFVYRSIIREKVKAGWEKTICVISLWEIPGLNRLIVLTDTGVNIQPDRAEKAAIIKNAVSFLNMFGYPRPRIAALSGKREIDGSSASYRDATELRLLAQAGELGPCEFMEETSFSEIFCIGRETPLVKPDDIDVNRIPDIILIPHLDTGNILVKLDFFLDVTRRSLVSTARGPIIIPSRSDPCDRIVGELALGVAAADRIHESRGEG